MKYVYIVLILALLVGGYFLVSSSLSKENAQEVPEGYHMMEDGTLMRNDAGMEGMGALDEMRTQAEEPAQQIDTQPVAAGENAKVFEVRGVNHRFDVEELRVQQGDTVTINFESTEGFHDWAIDEFDASTDKVQPGTPTSVTFVADEAGTFEYYCSVGNHRANGMVGTLIVEAI